MQAPSIGVRAPSNSMCSMRTWSWKYSMCRTGRTAQQGWTCSAGAQWADNGNSWADAQSGGLQEAGDAAAARGVGLQHVHRAGVQHAAEVKGVIAIFAGRDVHAGRAAVANQPQTFQIVGRTPAPRTKSRRARAKRRRSPAPACGCRRRWRRRRAPFCRRWPLGRRARVEIVGGVRADLHLHARNALAAQPPSCCCKLVIEYEVKPPLP